MNLKHLTDDELHLSNQVAAREEREKTTALLHHLCETERRKLYFKYGATSLWDYCTGKLKMSEGHASRRINTARTLAEFPEIEEKLNDGQLSLTNVSQAHTFFKQEAREDQPLSKETKKEILQQLEKQPTRNAEEILAKHSKKKRKPSKERVRRVNDSETEITIVVDMETLAQLKRLKEIWSHEMPNAKYGDVIRKAVKLACNQHDPLRKAERAKARKKNEKRLGGAKKKTRQAQPLRSSTQSRGATHLLDAGVTPVPEDSKIPQLQAAEYSTNRIVTRYIPAPVRHYVWLRDGGHCTYVDQATGEVCGSRHRVQYDHILPFGLGGSNTVDNLRLRCMAHNRMHSVQTYGVGAAKQMRN